MPEQPTEPQPGSPEWLLARTPTAAQPVAASAGAGVGWKIGTIVFGATTVVLAILLSGQLAAPTIIYQNGADASQTGAPAPVASPTVEAPQLTSVSQRVGELGLVIMQNYSAESGWPAGVEVADGNAVTAEGIVLGEVANDWILTYSVSADGSGFTLTLEDENGESAVFGPAAIDP